MIKVAVLDDYQNFFKEIIFSKSAFEIMVATPNIDKNNPDN